MEEDKKLTELFAVLRLNETVEVDYYGRTQKIKLSGIRGFIPVFDTYEKALEQSDNGKFQILVMNI